jgi:predicted transport protein
MGKYFETPEELVRTFSEFKNFISGSVSIPLSRKALNSIMIALQNPITIPDIVTIKIETNPHLSEKEICIDIGLDMVQIFYEGMIDPSEQAINQAKGSDSNEIFRQAREIQRKLIAEFLIEYFKSYIAVRTPPTQNLADIKEQEGKVHLKIKFEDTTVFITKEDDQTFLVKYAFTGVFIHKKLTQRKMVKDLVTIAKRKEYPISIVMDRECAAKNIPILKWTELSRVTVTGDKKMFKKELLYHLVFL